jgi:hypothetical protein
MTRPYSENKKHIYAYREKNREKLNQYHKKLYHNKKIWKLISIEFRFILLDD